MPANGDSAVVQTWYDTAGYVKKVDLAVTFDSGDGSFTSTALSKRIDGFLLKVVTDPGGTAPTNLYDITLTDAEGVDVLQSSALNRATATTEEAEIIYSATGNHPAISGADALTLVITGNSVNSATTQIIIYWSL